MMSRARWIAVTAGIAVASAFTVVAAPGTSGATTTRSAGRSVADVAVQTVGRVIVEDVLVPVPGQDPVPAYLVRQAGDAAPHSRAGILFLHWLGQIHSDRTEFLSEAIDLASHGAVSLLPQGSFPWVADPVGDASDVDAVIAQRQVFEAALRLLERVRAVDPKRVALVGHDYGAMYGALIADMHPDLAAAVFAAPDATWGNWFSTYWLGYTGARARAYNALFHGLQPVRHVARLGPRLLLQWAGQDIYVPEAVRDRFSTADPQAQVILYATADHQLTTRAQIDRDAFLTMRLDLTL
jgi:dienelactone hydrolase